MAIESVAREIAQSADGIERGARQLLQVAQLIREALPDSSSPDPREGTTSGASNVPPNPDTFPPGGLPSLELEGPPTLGYTVSTIEHFVQLMVWWATTGPRQHADTLERVIGALRGREAEARLDAKAAQGRHRWTG
jgi:hypothetical protein